MISYNLKKILIIISIIFNSVHISASNNSFFASIKKTFNSLTFKKPSFSINRRWIGVGALLIGGYAAWRYFSKKNSQNRPTNPITNELKPFDDTNIQRSNLINTEKKQQPENQMPIENPSEDDLDKILDEANSELFNQRKKTNPIEQQFQVNDIVKIIDDETSIEMAPIDKQMYKKIREQRGETPNYSIKKFYLNSIGIIRKIIANTITVEVRTKDKNGVLNCSNYITIAKAHVEKCDLKQLLEDQALQKGTHVRIELESEFLKNQLSPDELNKTNQYTTWYKYTKNLYHETFDEKQYYIATLNNYNQYTDNMNVTLYFHWREEITPYPLPITINKNKALIICDPQTNAPIIQ